MLLSLAAAIFCYAQAAQPARTFDVASIKPAAPLDVAKLMSGQLRRGMKVDAAHVDMTSMFLEDLIETAFKVKPHQLRGSAWRDISPSGGPRFDIHATLPPGATEKDVPELLQALLVERFGLKFHWENSEQTVYALIVGKDGPKMKPSTGPAGKPKISMQDGIMHVEVERTSMDRLADLFSELLGSQIVNQTGLQGDFQVTLDIAQSEVLNVARRRGAALEGAPAEEEASEPGGGTIFQTVKSLGLKLEPRKAALGLLVIDHLEKTPSEN